MSENRQNPDSFLEASRAEADSARGKLKIYIGMAAGVGKTYAMLADAQKEQERGVNVLAGYIEPHGRQETESLIKGLNTLPPLEIKADNISLKEFDLNAALKLKPDLILVDELAHSNAVNCVNQKRWQDIENLLSAGISVYTTVNIQHLESLNDTVSQITGIKVQETVPDKFIQEADEIELIDIPPAELIRRLKEGKIYTAEKVERALQNFFREGNLLALRELVLRHSAKSVGAQVQRFRRINAVSDIWPSTERILVLIGPNPSALLLVRQAKKLANSLNAELLALSLELPEFINLNSEQRNYISAALKLAESLGAETVVRPAGDIIKETLSFCAERNITAIVLGKSLKPRWLGLFQRSLVDEFIRQSSKVSLHIINTNPRSSIQRLRESVRSKRELNPRSVAYCLLIVALASLVVELLHPYLALTNLAMIYLIAIIYIAPRFGYRESIISSIVAVAAFDFFFVPPRFTFAVESFEYLITFIVMLAVSLLISNLAKRLKLQAKLAYEGERRSAGLQKLAENLLQVQNISELRDVVGLQIRRALNLNIDILVPLAGIANSFESQEFVDEQEKAVAGWVLQHNSTAGIGTATLPGAKSLYLPLGSEDKCQAVLRIVNPSDIEISFEKIKLLEVYAAQISLGLQRLLNEQATIDAEKKSERDQVRNILLSAVSHDLRTPLAIITGSVTALQENTDIPKEQQNELLKSIQLEAQRLSRIVHKVLDITRFEAGGVELKKDWCSIEEIIGSALEHTKSLLFGYKIETKIEANLPLIFVDAVLIDQVLVNILENVARHTPLPGSVTISAQSTQDNVILRISDSGAGLPKGMEEMVFEKHYSANTSNGSGIGLGLTLARLIIELHAGKISARNLAEGGACFEIKLPINIVS